MSNVSLEVRRKQGFAVMNPERRREVARKGGKAAQATGKVHKWTSDEARDAGRIGGAISRKRRVARLGGL